MTIRIKAFLIIAAIMSGITLTTMATSLPVIRGSLEETMQGDISVMADLGDKLVSSEIALMKADAELVAQKLLQAPREDWARVAQEQLETSFAKRFSGLTVFDRQGLVLASGREPTPAGLGNSGYIRRAFAGEKVISTSRPDPVAGIVFHVCVPLGGRHVLSATVPGMVFSDLLGQFSVWETGTLFILDSEGTILANERRFLVISRYNSIAISETDPTARSAADFARLMIRGGKGVGRYSLFGEDRLAAYTSISGSDVGWSLGVSAPISKSPAAYVDKGLMLTALIFLSLGTLAAFLASKIIAEPFNTIAKQNANLAALNVVAQNASEAKSNFLANMSHEMRTPLNAIIGFSELMLKQNMDQEEKEKNLRKIHTSGTVLLDIVNDILDISKIESGKFTIIPAEYDTASLINDTIVLNIMRIAEKSITFNVGIGGNLPCRLVGDELRVKQVCNNLLSNAFKYTNEGSVEFSVSSETDGDSVWLILSVRDTGIGIRPEDMSRLFSEYSQLDAKSNRKIEGTGLGLAITQKIVRMMDGEIDVDSEYGKGSTFTARIRQQFVTDVPLSPETVNNLKNFNYVVRKSTQGANLAIGRLPDAKVLVVDDVITNLDVTRGMLKPYDMRVDCVTSGQQAIALVREEKTRYDAIFMDHMMPGMDGIEAVRIIREEIGTKYAKNVPIIALTANALTGNQQMFLQHGFQDFLPKPVNTLLLDGVLKRWVRDRKRETGEQGDSPPGPCPEPSGGLAEKAALSPVAVAGLDLEKGLDRFSGDRDILWHSLRSYAVHTPALLEQMRAPDETRLKEYAIVAHGLKSSSYAICADTVGKMAEELEHAVQAGDFAFIEANNANLLEAAGKLLADLSAMLENARAKERKPEKDRPDAADLEKLRAACETYDMDAVDKIMAGLESFSYSNGQELIVWLRDRVDRMEFQQIQEKLAELRQAGADRG